MMRALRSLLIGRVTKVTYIIKVRPFKLTYSKFLPRPLIIRAPEVTYLHDNEDPKVIYSRALPRSLTYMIMKVLKATHSKAPNS